MGKDKSKSRRSGKKRRSSSRRTTRNNKNGPSSSSSTTTTTTTVERNGGWGTRWHVNDVAYQPQQYIGNDHGHSRGVVGGYIKIPKHATLLNGPKGKNGDYAKHCETKSIDGVKRMILNTSPSIPFFSQYFA